MTQHPPATRTGARAPRPLVRQVLPGLMLVMLLGALDQTIMAPALPAVAADLRRFGPDARRRHRVPRRGHRGRCRCTASWATGSAGKPGAARRDRGLRGRGRAVRARRSSMPGPGGLAGRAGRRRRRPDDRRAGGARRGREPAGAGPLPGPARRRVRHRRGRRPAARRASSSTTSAGAGSSRSTRRWALVALVAVAPDAAPARAARTGPSIDYAGAACLAAAVVALILLTQVSRGTPAAWPGWVLPMLAAVTVAAGAGWLLTARRARRPGAAAAAVP